VHLQPDEKDRANWAFGNPLTYNDGLAKVYGTKRFAHNEGFHGKMTTRFNLFKGKRWFQRKAHARLDVAMTYSITHALAMEQRRRVAASPPNHATDSSGQRSASRSSRLAAQ
jgi:hypothetical protein